MTKIEAIEFIEKYAERFKYVYLERCHADSTNNFSVKAPGIQVLAILSQIYPEIDQIQEEFFLFNKDPTWYVDKMIRIIQAHKPRKTNLIL